jgi:preprotein translocase subunit SecG
MKLFYLKDVSSQSYKILSKYSVYAAIIFFTITCCYANANKNVDEKLQKLLDNFRTKSNAPAAVLSINFPDNQ